MAREAVHRLERLWATRTMIGQRTGPFWGRGVALVILDTVGPCLSTCRRPTPERPVLDPGSRRRSTESAHRDFTSKFKGVTRVIRQPVRHDSWRDRSSVSTRSATGSATDTCGIVVVVGYGAGRLVDHKGTGHAWRGALRGPFPDALRPRHRTNDTCRRCALAMSRPRIMPHLGCENVYGRPQECEPF